ncbi:uncharacterized protein ELE39_000157 [Cryptosporidium sp. chipmunk genotype I]|uniref:uncharacterized protein n=1 Tax=Cryptosporidium sp. chipmunk genotype I TaxID=1280935 RepID=UPI00351AA759|nr:hypothetical protein ELE39_000157 [Cryptosporidium sp. chipmunk genotype I]
MNPYLDYQFLRNQNEGLLEDDGNYYKNYHFEHEGEYYDSNKKYYEEDEIMSHEINQSFVDEEVSCCPMEMIHRRRHSLSYKPNIKKGVRRADVSRIPKFRNPWDVQGELQPKRSKDVPLSYDEARFIREIWQDTRAQYEPSDGEIEEEFLFEEEYDDLDAEKRRNMLVKNGANLVRYSRHYQLPTISTIIKSSNPEQFRSRSFSPVGTRKNGTLSSGFNRTKRGSRSQLRDPTQQQYERGVREDFNVDNSYQYPNGDQFEYNDGDSRMKHLNNVRDHSLSQNHARGRIFTNQNDQIIRETGESNYRNHRNNDMNPSKMLRECPPSITPASSLHRNTVLGVPSELDNFNDTNNHSSVSAGGSRRATSPDLLSPTKSTGRGPPPKIGILEPIETSEGLIFPVNQHKTSAMNTPRMGNLTSRSATCSILGKNRCDIDHFGNSPENVPVVSPSGKQTIVFHMLPDSESNNSKATIFADPDTQNIVTELHIKPGVDINVISTPTGPAIEYEISGGRNAKAHINFSTSTNPDSSISIGDIPKIQTPREYQEQLNHGHNVNSSNLLKGHNHSYNDRSRSQSRRRSSLEEDGVKTNIKNNEPIPNMGVKKTYNNSNHNNSEDYLQQNHSQYPKSYVNHIVDNDEGKEENSPLKNNSKILNSTIDEAGRIFSEIERDFQDQARDNFVDQTRDIPEFLGFNEGNITNIETNTDIKHIESFQNVSGSLEKDSGINDDVFQNKDKHQTILSKSMESNNVINHGVAKVHPNPFLPVKKIQKRSGFSGCIMNTLTCSKVESTELKTFRALNPVEMINRSSEFY